MSGKHTRVSTFDLTSFLIGAFVMLFLSAAYYAFVMKPVDSYMVVASTEK